MAKTTTIQSGEKILDVMNLLLRHFTHGLSPSEVAKATGISPSNITRYVNTLEAKGFVERIADTDRIRPSVRLAQAAIQIMRSLDDARARIDEISRRITTER